MTKIRVDPPILQNSSQTIRTSATTLTSVGGNVTSAAAGAPSYDGQFGPKVRAIAAEASAVAGQLSSTFTNLSNWLDNKAQQFLNADNTSSAVLATQYNNLSWMSSISVSSLTLSSLPFFSWLSGLFPKGINLGTTIPGNRTIPSGITTSTNNNLQPKEDKFGELIKKDEEEAKEKQAADQTNQWWFNVPTKSQMTTFGCTITVASMIFDYWHSKDNQNKTISDQDLLNYQKKFPKGRSASFLPNDLKSYGYIIMPYPDSDKKQLIESLKKGPVLAVVKLNMAQTGYNHAVVVTGISENDEVMVNDPETGGSQGSQIYTWKQFSQSWGANFGEGEPKNSFVSILPDNN